eukprot:TRINITY_DN58912_c0_g1_i1.p1 TRINITY_DN58912_c0_g1~~TRINITY_DN58912_c0_g1_i1.p1  ORF type:complete len:460 (-),score=98.12 TRINITY_DN58912_c0_g1_i1:34-1413(-)
MRRANNTGKSLIALPSCVSTRSAAVEPLPSLVGHAAPTQGRGAASILKRAASSSLAQPRSSVSAAVGLTPSLALIADKDVLVEVRGGPSAPPFRVGGKNGNIVTSSTMSRIHRGWRIVAVGGQRVAAQEVAEALAAAQKAPRYTVTFSMTTDQEDEDKDQAKELERKHLEEEARRLREAEEQEEAERLQRQKAEEEKEKERQRRLAAEAETAEKEEAERRAAARVQAERVLEESKGLPPRATVEEPQRALMAALGSQEAPSKAPPKSNGPCDKCDGPHDTDECPHFKGPRDNHKDAFEHYGQDVATTKEEASQGPLVLRSARVVRQPGDGSCLFHSLSFGLKSTDAGSLRAEIADYIAQHPGEEVAGNPIQDWVLWDSGLDPKSYALTMRDGSRWGGAVELAICAKIHDVCVDVFEKLPGGFTRISSFGDTAAASSKSGSERIKLLYGGRVHYDALETQ